MSVLKMLERQLIAREAREQARQSEDQGDRWQGLVTALAGELDRMMEKASAPSADLAARLQRLELATAHQNSSAGLEARLTRLESAIQESQAPGTELAAKVDRLKKDVATNQTTTSRHAAKLDRLDRGVGAGNSSFLDLAARLHDLETAQNDRALPTAAHPEAPQNAAPQTEPVIAFQRDGAGLIRHVDIGGRLFRVERGVNREITRLVPMKEEK